MNQRFNIFIFCVPDSAMDCTKITKIDPISPWNVNKLEDFLHYCCPECEEKNPSRNDFIQHAQNQHPESIAYLFRFHAKEEVLDGSDHVEKFEYTMDDAGGEVFESKDGILDDHPIGGEPEMEGYDFYSDQESPPSSPPTKKKKLGEKNLIFKN